MTKYNFKLPLKYFFKKTKKQTEVCQFVAPPADLCSVAPWHSSGSWRSILARQTLGETSKWEMVSAVRLCFHKLHLEKIAMISKILLLEVLVFREILAIQKDPARKTIIIMSEKTSNWWYGWDWLWELIKVGNVDIFWPDVVLHPEILTKNVSGLNSIEMKRHLELRFVVCSAYWGCLSKEKQQNKR